MARPSPQILEWPRLEPGFSLQYRYPVIFCKDVLDPENLILARSIAGSGELYDSPATPAAKPSTKISAEAATSGSSNDDPSEDVHFRIAAFLNSAAGSNSVETVFAADGMRTESVRPRALPEMGHKPRCLFVLDQGLLEARPDLKDRIRQYGQTHQDHFEMTSRIVALPGGESCKNDLSHLTTIYQAVADAGIDRHSCIVGIGGGAFLDVVGFAAATAHRGVRLIRIPTTVLAQNDASVGVKNGMNFAGRKNFIGSFAPPFAVLNDHEMLRTLSHRDKRAGMAEAVKVALIRDRAFFQWLEAHSGQLARFEDWTLEHLIFRCAELHLEQISQGGDPFESGSARPLDFGHWAAHKLEELSNHELRHGEAVALGMALDTLYSVKASILEESEGRRVLKLLENLGFNLRSEYLSLIPVEQALEEFREHLGGQLCITLLENCGTGIEVDRIEVNLMQEAIKELQSFASKTDKPKSRSQAGARQ